MQARDTGEMDGDAGTRGYACAVKCAPSFAFSTDKCKMARMNNDNAQLQWHVWCRKLGWGLGLRFGQQLLRLLHLEAEHVD